MEGRQPKRRKDKYNPYQIYEKDGKHYILFKDGEEIQKCMEIERTLYEEFNSFELQDMSYLNVVDRHLEQSEIWDSSLYERATKKEESVRVVCGARKGTIECRRNGSLLESWDDKN